MRLSNILVQHAGGGTKRDAARQLEEKEKDYPEPHMFGNTPAHGLLIRHAEDVEICDFKVIAATEDDRPCFRLDGVERVDFSNIKADRAANTPVFILDNVKNVSVVQYNSLPDTKIAETDHEEL